MSTSDGDGWVACRCGARHWGRFGAAGLVVVHPPTGAGASPLILLQHRASWVHDGGTWAVPGGARDSHEDVVTTALREAAEEVGIGAADVDVVACAPGLDHTDWQYTYVVAVVTRPVRPHRATDETADLAWTAAADKPPDTTRLHPALATDWRRLAFLARAVAAVPMPPRPVRG